MAKRWHVGVWAIFSLFWTCGAWAADWKEISAQELKGMMDAGKVMVINPLSRIEYNNLHIAGDVNIPLAHLTTDLPADKSKPLAFYCLGRK